MITNLKLLLAVSLVMSALFPARAQKGDEPGEIQTAPPTHFKTPAAPPLIPEEALKTFKLQPGFRMELVASEPMIESPVAMVFDPDGRIWVLEMRGFMPNVDGNGEAEPRGRISILEDTDGDGRIDKNTIFLKELVMPRGLALVRDGLLVAEPPKLWFCRDTNGDGQCDEKIEIANDYATQDDPKLGANANPEHASNGLMWALDNWIYSANHSVRFRNTSGKWERDRTAFRGQWGITQDDYGRLFHNSNSDPLRADLVPSYYLTRNPNLRNLTGINFQVDRNLEVWPIRVNPGVNRGYQSGQLRDDGTLATYTGACGPVIYRGDNFPPEFRGNAFLCEPTGNLVHRDLLEEKDGLIHGTGAYRQAEFLASTDERFRPVNLYTGPDGALYIVDMYRGLIQHHIYLTTYLRDQVLARGLDKPLNQGRIYRIVSLTRSPGPRPNLSKASSIQIVAALQHPNGWWRDTAQRLLIEHHELSILPSLRDVASHAEQPAYRVQALWTLDGLDQLDSPILAAALSDPAPKVQAAAIRLSESRLRLPEKDPTLLKSILGHTNSTNPEVLVQLAFTLGEVNTPSAGTSLVGILERASASALVREAVLSGLRDREWSFLTSLIARPTWSEVGEGRKETLASLSQCIFTRGKADEVGALLELAANQVPTHRWRQVAFLEGMAALSPSKRDKTVSPGKRLQLDAEPASLVHLAKQGDTEITELASRVVNLLAWSGKEADSAPTAAIPLTPEQQGRFDAGKLLYEATCAACHQPTGLGQEGLAPPLADSDWSQAPEGRVIRIVLQGLHGPITIKNRVYQLDMPPLAVLDDEQISSILTYVRRAWGHAASPVDPASVAKVRAATENRQEAWTEAELLKIQ